MPIFFLMSTLCSVITGTITQWFGLFNNFNPNLCSDWALLLTDQGAEKVDGFQDELLMSYSGDAQLLQFLMSDVQQLLSSHLLPLKILHILLETVIQAWWDDRKMRVRTLLAFLCGHCQSGMWVNHPLPCCCFLLINHWFIHDTVSIFYDYATVDYQWTFYFNPNPNLS